MRIGSFHTPSDIRPPGAPVVPDLRPPAAATPVSLTPDELSQRARAKVGQSPYADLLSPQMLAAMLELNADGTVATNPEGFVRARAPGSLTPDQEIAFGVARNEVWRAAQGGEGAVMSDSDHDFFSATTGSRILELGGGLYTIAGGDGRPVAQEDPAWQLGPTLIAHRRGGLLQGEISRTWFADVVQPFFDGGQYPAEWRDRAEAWFSRRNV